LTTCFLKRRLARSFRPADFGYSHYNGVSPDSILPDGSYFQNTGNPWLADRVPVVINGISPGWAYLSACPLGSSFESPLDGAQFTNRMQLTPGGGGGGGACVILR